MQFVSAYFKNNMIIYESKIGDSLSIGFLFNEAFDMSRLESVNVCLGSRIYTHTVIDQMIRCELKSEDTNKLNGTLKLTLEIDDSILGFKKRELGEVKFNVSNSQGSNASVNTGYDVVVPITINEQAIEVGDVMYNYVQGATGSVGDIALFPPIEIPQDTDVAIVQRGTGTGNSFSWAWSNIKLSLKTFFDFIYEPKKGNDDNYVTDSEKTVISNTSGVNTGDQDLSGLQPKETGKGLSTNDYTTSEKNKLAGIEAGAQANAANTVVDANYVHTDNNYTTTEKNKLSSIESGAQVNAPNTVVDANYVHTDNNFTTELKNKLDSITAIFTTGLKTAYDGAVSWVSNAGENIKTALGIFAGGSINKFLTEAGTFAPISVGGASSSPLYYNPTPSGIGAAKTLSYIPYPTEVEAQYTLTNTEQLLTSYVYPEPIATDTIDAGNWISKAVGRISSSSGSSFLRIEFSIYKDGVKTLLFSKSSDEINNTTFESIPGDAANGVFAVDPTGFLWVDMYGVTSGANRTLYLKIGDGNASFIQTPLRASHEGLRDLNGDSNFLHVTSSEKQTWNDKQPAGDYATNTALNNHVNAVTAHTKSQVGLGNVDNTRDMDKPVSTAQQEAISLVANKVTNVDNTRDMDKPVSTAQQAAINLVANSFPNRQAPVTNVADLATTYPSAASDGTWAAMVTSVGIIYCKNASGNWVSTGLKTFPEDVEVKGNIVAPILTPLADVATVAALKTTYPTAVYGNAAKVTADGFIYSFNGVNWLGTGAKNFPSDIATITKLKRKSINNAYYDGFFNRIDSTYTVANSSLANEILTIQTPVGNRLLHVNGNTTNVNDKLFISRNINRTFKVGEKWIFAYVVKSVDGNSIGKMCYTNISGSNQEIYEPTYTEALSDNWYYVEFNITVASEIANPFVKIELKQSGTTTEAYIACILLFRNSEQDIYDLMSSQERFLVEDILTLKSTLSSDITSIKDDRSVVYDSLFENGIPTINVLYGGSGTKEIVKVTSPEGAGFGVKVTSASNFSFRINLEPHGLQTGDKITLSYLIYAGGTSIGAVWSIAYFNGGLDQQYSPTKTDIGNGWWRYTQEFTLSSTAAASSYYSLGAFIMNLSSTTAGYVILTGYKVIYPVSRYTYPEWGRVVKKLKSDSDFLRKKTRLLQETSYINVFGDSLTAYNFTIPAGIKQYTSFLQDLVGTNFTINNFGVGGENTSQIAARQGGNQLLIDDVTGITIPATTTAVALTLNVSGLLLQGNAGLNPCKICGIEGNLSLAGGIYYFTRSTAGTSQKVPYRTQLFTNAQLNNRNGILVIGSGTNDVKATVADRQLTIDMINRIIRNSRSFDQIVMLPHSHVTDYAALADMMKIEFGNRCVDIRSLMVSQGVQDAINSGWIQEAIDNASYSGSNAYKRITSYSDTTRISFTGNPNDYLTNATVLDDISNNRVPSIFMTDGTHFNLIGMHLQAKYLYERIQLLGLI